MVMMILPIITGAIALSLISVLSLQGSVVKRASDASDAQVLSTNFENDIHSAAQLTTASTPQCGPSSETQLLALRWGLGQSGSYNTVISYVRVQVGATWSLVRDYCASGTSATPTSSITLSHDITSTLSAPTISPTTASSTAATGWASTIGITAVQYQISEPASSYNYTLVAVPAAGSSSGVVSNVGTSAPGCNFATPGTGTYVKTLCFVDFSGLNVAQAGSSTPSPACPSGGQSFASPIAGTPDTMTFCLLINPDGSTMFANNTSSCLTATGPICPATIPTYFAPPTSEAFLGNNGFYMGIAGRPALYQSTSGQTTTLYFTNIKVTDSNGNAATSWNLVTGDAESTDSSESITWSTCSSIPVSPATCSSSVNLSLLPDSPASAIGNACAYSPAPTGTQYPGTWLTGIGTNTVECAASVSSDKTGTVMVYAPTPTTLTVTMVGQGLQAMFLGLLLP